MRGVTEIPVTVSELCSLALESADQNVQAKVLIALSQRTTSIRKLIAEIKDDLAWLTIDQVADQTGVAPRTLRRLCLENAFKSRQKTIPGNGGCQYRIHASRLANLSALAGQKEAENDLKVPFCTNENLDCNPLNKKEVTN